MGSPSGMDADAGSWRQLGALFAGHGVSSIGLSLVNKRLMLGAPSEAQVISLLVVQTVFATALNHVMSALRWYEISAFTAAQVRAVLPVAFCFVLLIHSGLKALSSSHVALVVVFRNMSPLATAAIDGWYHRKTVVDVVPALVLMVVGASLYATGDMSATAEGYAWLTVNLAVSALLNVLEGNVTRQLKDEQTSNGVSQLRNLLSLVLLVLMLLVVDAGGVARILDFVSVKGNGLGLTLVSCVFGYTIGMFYFALQAQVSPTSVSVANCSYKIITVALSVVLFETELRPVAFAGLSLSFLGVFWYMFIQHRKTMTTPEKVAAP